MIMTTTTLRILIADDHDVMREGTRALIERQPGWEVCGVAGTGREAVAQALLLQPNIVIMDMSMPELNGLDVRSRSNDACRAPRFSSSRRIKRMN